MRIALAMLAVTASVLIGLPTGVGSIQSAAAATAEQCTNWTSTRQPPPDIAVYRVSEGRVERVPFQLYVARVLSLEWGVKYAELRRAGAVAVKQFAWYHVLHWRGGTHDGECFDVRDTTRDQLYAAIPPTQITDSVLNAVKTTWTWRMSRDGRFIMTGYRRGEAVPCAQDAGYRLHFLSARRCVVRRGWDTKRLLQVYYTADLIT